MNLRNSSFDRIGTRTETLRRVEQGLNVAVRPRSCRRRTAAMERRRDARASTRLGCLAQVSQAAEGIMGTTRAGELLRIMSVREAIHEERRTHPHASVVAATRLLVSKLNLLPPDELIEIKYEVDPIRAWYLRCQTGEVLAEIDTSDER
jgi:hypothetical protein